jgi:hypothetical protein
LAIVLTLLALPAEVARAEQRETADRFATLPDGPILGDELFVTNLALPLTPAVGDEPEEDVTRYTISRIKLHKD